MSQFAWGCLVGWLLFLPSAVAGVAMVTWVVGLIRNPRLVLGLHTGLFNLKRHPNLQRSISFMEETGYQVKHLRGHWYWVTRAKG